MQQTVRLIRSSGGKSSVSPLADDDVSVHGNTERRRDRDDLLRHLDVRALLPETSREAFGQAIPPKSLQDEIDKDARFGGQQRAGRVIQ